MLNEQQRLAVEATEGNVRVVAGAGSGKTRVLAHRFAYLVNDLGISPANILCLTFTNKAAQEMKMRISRLVDGGSVNDFICTIHSFCTKLLRRDIYRLGYPATFTVIDETDAKILAKQAMDEFGIDRRKTTADRFLDKVSAYKGANSRTYITRHLLPSSNQNVKDAVERFLKLQLKQFTLDFDDLLYFACHILENFEDARKYWTEKLNYIMVDEAQDCSEDDWRLLRLLEACHHNLFIVGDPDQAIYEWRGAKPQYFVNFKPSTDIVLDRNYRSTPDILNVANSIIANNKNRIPKELYTVKLNEVSVCYTHYKSEAEEAQGVAQRIQKGINRGESPASFAVLYRASFISRRIEQELLKLQIPYSVWGGVKFFDRKEIKDIICYLRLVANDLDDIAFSRIINIPARKFGKVSMLKLQKIADATNLSLFQALQNSLDTPPFNKPALRKFVDIIMNARHIAQELPVSELANQLLTSTGLNLEYRNDKLEDRLENITELINSMKEFEMQSLDEGDATLYGYLQEIALYSKTDDFENADKVKLMTIHQSKGLEFPNVFIMGLTEGIFPNHRSIRERLKDGEEEERRLMYVGVTRAENRLYLSESEGFSNNNNGAMKCPSRFIGEIPDEQLTIEGHIDPELLEATRKMVRTLNLELGFENHTDAPAETSAIYPPSTPVRHKIFGIGMIESYDKEAGSYRVRFEAGVRNLLPRVLEILKEKPNSDNIAN